MIDDFQKHVTNVYKKYEMLLPPPSLQSLNYIEGYLIELARLDKLYKKS